MSTPQLFIKLLDKNKDPDGLHLIQVAVAKQKFPHTHITGVAAVGYSGGGTYSDFYGIYRTDEYDESVVETIEEMDYPENSENFSDEMAKINNFLFDYIYYDEDYDAYRLNEEFIVCIASHNSSIDIDFDWDNDSHIEASSKWPISYRW